MSKIKLFAILSILCLVIMVLNISPVFVSKAESDFVLQEIASYKTWTKITGEPIKVASSFQIDGSGG